MVSHNTHCFLYYRLLIAIRYFSFLLWIGSLLRRIHSLSRSAGFIDQLNLLLNFSDCSGTRDAQTPTPLDLPFIYHLKTRLIVEHFEFCIPLVPCQEKYLFYFHYFLFHICLSSHPPYHKHHNSTWSRFTVHSSRQEKGYRGLENRTMDCKVLWGKGLGVVAENPYLREVADSTLKCNHPVMGIYINMGKAFSA